MRRQFVNGLGQDPEVFDVASTSERTWENLEIRFNVAATQIGILIAAFLPFDLFVKTNTIRTPFTLLLYTSSDEQN